MKKDKRATIIALIAMLLLIIISGLWVDAVNSLLNSFKKVDRNCNVASDCRLAFTKCTSGCPAIFEPVNVNYAPYCPIRPWNRGYLSCPSHMPKGSLACIDNICVVNTSAV